MRVATPGFGKVVLIGGAVLALAAFVAVFVASVWQSPNIGGVLGGLLLGFMAGLIVLGTIAAALMLWLRDALARDGRDGDEAAGDAIAAPLKPVLEELEATRRDIVRQVHRRALWRVPLCAGGAVVLWGLGEAGDLFDLVSTTAGGGAVGYGWASIRLGERYRSLYKQRVLPRLAARFGPITWRPARQPDMRLLREEHLFRSYDRMTAEDELVGTYRGLDVSIVELTLRVGSGENERRSFDGLLVEIKLPRSLSGTTAVVSDAGWLDRLRDWLARNGRERVRLEDPRFESLYQVWGSDQIAARALLTPAFMERFLALAERPGFGRPQALARDNLLLLAIPKSGGSDYFEPPSFLRPAVSHAVLLRLDRDIACVLAMADAVIGLDHSATAFAAAQAQRTPEAARRPRPPAT